MKTYTKASVSKLVARFDNELKNILMEDIKALKASGNRLIKTINPERLTAA